MEPYEFNREKFDNLVHYIIWKCPNPGKLGSVKLQKILWRSDSRMYMEARKPITGARYRRQKRGPATHELLGARERLKAAGLINFFDMETAIWKPGAPMARGKKDIYQAIQPPAANFLSEKEKKIVDFWIDEICIKHTADSISEDTHGYAWEIIPMGEEMPLSSIFVDRIKDEPSEEVLEWARSEVRRLG